MRRAVGGTLMVSLFLFLLSLPMLHLHPAAAHHHNAVIHSHLPPAHAVDGSGSAHARDVAEYEASDFESVPVEISALCPSGLSQAPGPELSALPTVRVSIEPGLEPEYLRPPDPKAQAPPAVLIYHTLRSPPA